MKMVFCMVLLLSFIACNRQQNFPNRFSIKRQDTGTYVIVSPPEIAANGITYTSGVIDPDVTKIAVLGDLVVGFSVPVKESDGAMTWMTSGGYFLLDTKSKQTKQGLKLDDLRKVLADDYRVFKEPDFKSIRRY